MNKSIFETLTECATDETFDHILFQDKEYKRLYDEVVQMKAQAEKLSSPEEKQMIEDLASKYSLLGICDIRLAYQQGFKDCASFLVEVGMVK